MLVRATRVSLFGDDMKRTLISVLFHLCFGILATLLYELYDDDAIQMCYIFIYIYLLSIYIYTN